MAAAQGAHLSLEAVVVISSDEALRFFDKPSAKPIVEASSDSPRFKRGRVAGDDVGAEVQPSISMDLGVSAESLVAAAIPRSPADFFASSSPAPAQEVAPLPPLIPNVASPDDGVPEAPAGLDSKLFGGRISNLASRFDTFEAKLASFATLCYVDELRSQANKPIVERVGAIVAEFDEIKNTVSSGFKDQAAINNCLDEKIDDLRPSSVAVRMSNVIQSAPFKSGETLTMPSLLAKIIKGFSKSQLNLKEDWLIDNLNSIVLLRGDSGAGKGGGRGKGSAVSRPDSHVLEFKTPKVACTFLDAMASVDFTKAEWMNITIPAKVISLSFLQNWTKRPPQINSEASDFFN
ncbi:hypothetical protein M885DRAFT_501413 [Pelagophyceae sp. CCMP2097]|nr:hypothetical protein M885DRAFT_501413 [Pelagophyceae sp. CCMP2097]